MRLLMRRDQVRKACANHPITSDMRLKALDASDRAWIYATIDYADEEVGIFRSDIENEA